MTRVVAELASIDQELATMAVPYEEWEVLYRQRLQVERDLRAGAMAGEAVIGAETPGDRAERSPGGPGRISAGSSSPARPTIADAATDKETVEALDKLAGPDWRVAVRLASVGASALQAAVREPSEDEDAELRTERPASRSRRRTSEEGAGRTPPESTVQTGASSGRAAAP